MFVPKRGYELETEFASRSSSMKSLISLNKEPPTTKKHSDSHSKEGSFGPIPSLSSIPEDIHKHHQRKRSDSFRRRRLVSRRVNSQATTSLKSLGIIDSQDNSTTLPSSNSITSLNLGKKIKDRNDTTAAPSLTIDEEDEFTNVFKASSRNYFIGEVLKVKFSSILGPGEHFGSRGMLKNSLYKQAVIASSECHCITLSKEDFQATLERELLQNQDKINFFSSIFPEADKETLTGFSILWNKHLYKRGDTIYQEDDSCHNLYIVLEGELTVH